MNLLRELYFSPWWPFVCGCCALAVLVALARNIAQQDRTLPPPESRCAPQKDLWISSGGKS